MSSSVIQPSVYCQNNDCFSYILQKTVFTTGYSNTAKMETLAMITKGSAPPGGTQVYSGEKLLIPSTIPSFTPGSACSLINVKYIVQVNSEIKIYTSTNRMCVYVLYNYIRISRIPVWRNNTVNMCISLWITIEAGRICFWFFLKMSL